MVLMSTAAIYIMAALCFVQDMGPSFPSRLQTTMIYMTVGASSLWRYREEYDCHRHTTIKKASGEAFFIHPPVVLAVRRAAVERLSLRPGLVLIEPDTELSIAVAGRVRNQIIGTGLAMDDFPHVSPLLTKLKYTCRKRLLIMVDLIIFAHE